MFVNVFAMRGAECGSDRAVVLTVTDGQRQHNGKTVAAAGTWQARPRLYIVLALSFRSNPPSLCNGRPGLEAVVLELGL